MKYTETSYGNRKSILSFTDHYVAVPIMIDSTDVGVVTDSGSGRKILPAGTIVGGGFLTGTNVKATTQNDADAEGVLMYDVDVTYGDAPGAAIIHGFVSLAKLPAAPAAEAKTALRGIAFLA